MLGGTLNGILSVSPALKITDAEVTVQVLTTLDGDDEVPQDKVAARIGKSKRRLTVGIAPDGVVDVTAAAMIAHRVATKQALQDLRASLARNVKGLKNWHVH